MRLVARSSELLVPVRVRSEMNRLDTLEKGLHAYQEVSLDEILAAPSVWTGA